MIEQDDKILILLDNLRQLLEASRAEVLWMATNRGRIISACEEVIRKQAVEISQLKTEAAKRSTITDSRMTEWVHDLTTTIVQQRDDLVTARLKREELSAEHTKSNDRVLALLEEAFGKTS